MKRYDSITVIKAISCLMVFMTHWNGAFASWGHASLDWLVLESPFRLILYGNMAVCIFLMLSGALVSLKVYKSSSVFWTGEMLKRYLRMAIPIFGTHMLVYLLLKTGLFRTGQAAALMGNEWLAAYYAQPIGIKSVFFASFITSIFRGDSSFYGPLWMMNYIFFGTAFSIILTEGLKGMSRRGKVLFLVILFGFFLVLNSYYLCFLMGNLLAQLILWLEAWMQKDKCSHRKMADGEPVDVKEAAGSRVAGSMKRKGLLIACSAGILGAGALLALKSFQLTVFLQSKGLGMALGDAVFWGMISGFLLIWGGIFLWELLCSERRSWWKRPFLWIGERSYSVFLVHWLVICTFSCEFYCRFFGKPAWISVGVNFAASMVFMLICTQLFYMLVEKRAFEWSWSKVKFLFLTDKKTGGGIG